MPAPSETELIQFRGWTLRLRRAPARAARLLLLLHGWTGDENSMWVFARNLPEDYWILAPRAPHVTKPSGYSWRVPPPERSEGPGLDDLRTSAKDLIGLVDAYAAEEHVQAQVFDVMGFSQGAALGISVALLFPERVDKVAVLAGFVPRGAEMLISKRPLEGKHFFVAHGTMDELVNIAYARQSTRLLEAAGARVTACEDEVGHKVSAECLRGLQAFMLG